MLYFTADFHVQPIWPTQNLSNRLAPGETTRVGLMIQPGSTAGLEEIWTLAVPATISGDELLEMASSAIDARLTTEVKT